MKIQISITGLKPLSLNNAQKITTRGKFVKKYKTAECIQFESLFLSKMRLWKSECNKLNKYFDEKKHCLHIEYRSSFIIEKKNGELSKTSSDADNIIKIMQDCMFKSFTFNDAYITKVSSEKIHCDKPSIDITVRILTYRH